MRYLRLSAPGPSALSIWRLEGPAQALEELCGTPLPILNVPRLVRVPDGAGGLLDEGLLWLRRGAGRRGVRAVQAELHLHGGSGVASALRTRMNELGWSEDQRPQDSDRQALLRATCPLSARLAAARCGGALARQRRRMLDLELGERRAVAAGLLRWRGWAELLERPPLLVLAGPPNAGKSTLFNAWLRAERVTVSPYPGTTRDAVEARILVGSGAEAFAVRLLDTAGLWDAPEALDQAAVAATEEVLATCWRVLWVLDAAAPPPPRLRAALAQARPNDLCLLHRTDLGEAWNPEATLGRAWLRGSILRDDTALLQRLEEALLAPLGPPPPPGLVLPTRAESWAELAAWAGA